VLVLVYQGTTIEYLTRIPLLILKPRTCWLVGSQVHTVVVVVVVVVVVFGWGRICRVKGTGACDVRVRSTRPGRVNHGRVEGYGEVEGYMALARDVTGVMRRLPQFGVACARPATTACV
jgi:hypothetical protein